MRGRGADHQEPEERAKTDDENRRVQRQLDPGYAYGGRPYQEQRACRQHRIKRAEENVSGTRERIVPSQPGNGSDAGADEIHGQRERQADPPRSQRTTGGTAGRGRRNNDAREGRRRVGY